MKYTISFLLLLNFFWACNSSQSEKNGNGPTAYGQVIPTDEARAASQAAFLLNDKDSIYVRLSGTVASSCAKKGCWMMVDLGQGEHMRVTFKDYGFFVPKDLKGEQIVMEGTLKREISSVEEQWHYAEDAGKSPQEVAAILVSDTVYTFEAVGVMIWPKLQKE